jgi:hypothetical protein
MRIKHAIFPALLLAAAAAVGCGESENTATAGDYSAHSAKPVVKGSVKLVTPTDGQRVGSTFTAKVDLKDFKIDTKNVGKAPRPGYGHLHFQLDEGKYDYPKYSGENGKIAVQLGVDGKYSPALAPEITYRNVPKGKHTLEIYLAHNNHVDTGAEDELEIVVE